VELKLAELAPDTALKIKYSSFDRRARRPA